MSRINRMTQSKMIARIEKLGEKPKLSSIEELADYLWNGDKIVSRYAAWALIQIPDRKGIEILLERFGEEHDLDLEVLVEYLKEKSDVVIKPLINALYHENEWTRREAAFFLGELGCESTLEALINAAHDECDWVRYAARDALSKITGTDSEASDKIERLRNMCRNGTDIIVKKLGEIVLGKEKGTAKKSYKGVLK